QEEHHLVVPIVRAQWPAVMENDGLGARGAPVLVVNVRAVPRSNVSHGAAILRQRLPADRTGAASSGPMAGLGAGPSSGSDVVATRGKEADAHPCRPAAHRLRRGWRVVNGATPSKLAAP